MAEVVEKVGQLLDIVAAVHEQDLVLRDLKPNNLMVTPAGRLQLIDLEGAVQPAPACCRLGTAGYVAPDQASALRIGQAPSPQADLFSLGATNMYLSCGINPALPADEPAHRSYQDRLDTVLSRAGMHMTSVHSRSPMVMGLVQRTQSAGGVSGKHETSSPGPRQSILRQTWTMLKLFRQPLWTAF